jgi:hypothetical protein
MKMRFALLGVRSPTRNASMSRNILGSRLRAQWGWPTAAVGSCAALLFQWVPAVWEKRLAMVGGTGVGRWGELVPFPREDQALWLRRLAMLIAGAAISLAASTQFVQAESVGGTIGKQNKSVSGEEESAPPRRKSVPKATPSPNDEKQRAHASRSISGLWYWTGQCAKYDKPYTGTITISQSGNGFSGTHGGTNMWDQGTVSNGRINGNHVSFTRTFGQYTDHLDLTLSGSGSALRMTGVIPNTEHSGRCAMRFTKN